MFKKVLVPLDGSKVAESALAHIKNMAWEGSIEKVILLTITQVKFPVPDIVLPEVGILQGLDSKEPQQAELNRYRNYLKRMKNQLRSEGIKAEAVVSEGNDPAKNTVDFCEENNVDLIVIATHGYRGMKKLFLGSVASKVMHESRIPVLLIRVEETAYQPLSPGLYDSRPPGAWLHS